MESHPYIEYLSLYLFNEDYRQPMATCGFPQLDSIYLIAVSR